MLRGSVQCVPTGIFGGTGSKSSYPRGLRRSEPERSGHGVGLKGIIGTTQGEHGSGEEGAPRRGSRQGRLPVILPPEGMPRTQNVRVLSRLAQHSPGPFSQQRQRRFCLVTLGILSRNSETQQALRNTMEELAIRRLQNVQPPKNEALQVVPQRCSVLLAASKWAHKQSPSVVVSIHLARMTL